MTTQSTERSANDSGTPYIGAVSIPSLHPGDTPPDFIVTNITNGAFEIVFTDKDGKPLASAGNPIPACALDVNQAPLPPCHLAMRLTPNKAYFYFSGTIADGTRSTGADLLASHPSPIARVTAVDYERTKWVTLGPVHVEV